MQILHDLRNRFALALLGGVVAFNVCVGHPRMAASQACERYVTRGDVLLFHGWYNGPANKVIRSVYERCHKPAWHDPATLGAASP